MPAEAGLEGGGLRHALTDAIAEAVIALSCLWFGWLNYAIASHRWAGGHSRRSGIEVSPASHPSMPDTSRTLKTLPPLERHLEAARGWLLLNAPQEAGHELDRIEERHRLDTRVLVVRAGVFQALEDWTRLVTVAQLLCDAQPQQAQWPLSLAVAVRSLYGPARAIGILMEACEQFPEEPAVYYDLACCEALTGSIKIAHGWLKEAMRLEPRIRETALKDPDLAALRTEL